MMRLDTRFRELIRSIAEESAVERCFQCGSCTGGCPAGINVRRLIHESLLGLRDRVVKSKDVWLCTVCYTCQERCPSGVNVTETMIALRNLSVREKLAPRPFLNIMRSLFERAYEFPFTNFTRRLRAELGLEETLPLAVDDPAAAEEIRSLMKLCGVNEMLKAGDD